jgi:SAM-dependent methyltransferase
MRRELLELLVCPTCRSTVEIRVPPGNGSEVYEGDLVCTGCSSGFAIIDGIPRMVKDIETASTADRFAYEWQSFPEISDFYESQFLDWIAPIGHSFFCGKTILDAGCGKGRHVLLAARFGAKRVVGLDVGKAIDVAYANTKVLPNVELVQGDLCRPPLRQVFDYIYCVGVLHHLPRPEEGFKALCRLLQPSGTISIWVYGREGNGWIVYLVNPLRKFLTAKMPLVVLKALSWPLAALLFAASKFIYRPVNVCCKSLSRFLFYNDYLCYIAQFDFKEIHSIVFDHLLAPVAFYLRKEEVLSWFETSQFTDVRIAWHNKNSWRVTARKSESGDAHP